MEYFQTLTAVQSGSAVVLAWTLPVPGVTSVAVQRSPFGGQAWTTLSTLAVSTLTYTDTPAEVGSYEYRLAVTTTLGSVDHLGTLVYSNQVSIEAGSVMVSLSGTAALATGPLSDGNTKTVRLTWTIGSGDANEDVEYVVVDESLNSGVTWRPIAKVDEFKANTWAHQLPTGLGSVSYRVRAHLPPGSVSATKKTGQLQTPIQVTSNTVTLTV